MNSLRKLTALFLALAVAAALLTPGLPLPAGAEEENPVLTVSDIRVNPLYADILTEEDLNKPQDPPVPYSDPVYLTSTEEAGEIIREGMKARAETITIYFQVPKSTYTEEGFKAQVWEMVAWALVHTGVPTEGDYLNWQCGGIGYNASGQYGEANGETVLLWTIPLELTYYTTLDQEEQVDQAVEKLLESWDLAQAPDYLKIRTIYDYICSHVTYDHAHVNDSSYTLQYTAYGALQNGTAVCQGYAVLLYRLALELDVDCRLIAGKGNNEAHGWNIVELKGLYYNVDSTWDAEKTKYQYFLKCEENFGNHTRDEDYDTAEFHAAYTMTDADYVPTASDTCYPHVYDDGKVTTEATCTAEGVKTYTCTNCGETYSESIPTTDHYYEAAVTAPTCTEKGYTTYTCADCGHSYVGDETAALGHDLAEPVYDPETKTHSTTCSRCDYTDSEDCTFDEGKVITEATETAPGEKEFTCTVCGGTYTEEIAYVAPSEIVRLSGRDRYATAFAVADRLKEVLGVEAFDTIVVAYGRGFPDALAGSYLATELDAPILLTEDSVQEDVLAYIADNLSEDGMVYILGGTAAVSQAFEDALAEADIRCERLSGKSRYDTNLAILEETGLNGKQILVCTGESFADSLSASATNLPILLVNSQTNKLTTAQEAYLETLESCTFYIIGGTAAISEKLETAIAAYGRVQRVYGKGREATSVKVAETFFKTPDTVALAYSRNFPDGLCGGPLAYNLNAPLLLVNSGAESDATAYVEENGVKNGIILGGSAAVSDSTVSAVFGN